jgi:hypothetical protein
MKSQLWFTPIRSFLTLLILTSTSHVAAKSSVSDQVQQAELQFAICEATPAQIVKALRARVVKREIRQTYYLETPERDLQAKGAIVRYRQTAAGVKSSVKKTFELAGQIPHEIFDDYNAGCEVDAYLSRAKIGCSVKELDTEIGELSKAQKGFLRISGIGPDKWKAAKVFGPVQNDSYDLEIDKTLFALDLISIPSGAVLYELSTRVPLADALGLQGRLVEMLRISGLRLCETQEGVTKKILDHYLGPAT